MNCDIAATPVGNTTTGYSGMLVNSGTLAVTTNFPFRIKQLYSDFGPAGSNGTDNTTNFNWAVLTFNNQDFKAGQVGI
jgi:hypothetical protein